MDMVEASCWNL